MLAQRCRRCRFSRLLKVALVCICLTACTPAACCGTLLSHVAQGYYSVTLENRSPRPIEVEVSSLGRWTVQPCSAWTHLVGHGPPLSQAKEVTMRDQDGALLARWPIRDCSGSWWSSCNLRVQYPEQGSGDCPGDARTQYFLKIENGLKRDLHVVFQEQDIGIVLGSGEATFGPFTGDWAASPVPSYRDDTGRVLEAGHDYWNNVADVEYELGEVPVLTLFVIRS